MLAELFWLLVIAVVFWIAWQLLGRDGDDAQQPDRRIIIRAKTDEAYEEIPPPPSRRELRSTARRFAGQLTPLRIPLDAFPEIGVVHVASHSEPGVSREVDLASRTCSCPDFVKRRAQLSQDDARRLCRHAIDVLGERVLLGRVDDLTRLVLQDRFFTSYDGLHETEIGGVRVIIAFREGERWVNLFGPNNPKTTGGRQAAFLRFGYDLHDRRWAYGETPRWIRGASAAIRDLFPAGS